MIIPSKQQSYNQLFYKTDDYVQFHLEYNSPIPINTVTGKLKDEFDSIHLRYNIPFRIVTVDDNVQIFCENNLHGLDFSIYKFKVYITDYCQTIKFIIELSKIIEDYL